MSHEVAPMCLSCVHLTDDGPDADGWPLVCSAFPRGIPEDILASRFDHRQPHEGDRGILFAQDPAMPGLGPIEELLARAGTR